LSIPKCSNYLEDDTKCVYLSCIVLRIKFTLSHVFNFPGKSGDWKNHFTVAESEMYDAVIERELGETGIQLKCV